MKSDKQFELLLITSSTRFFFGNTILILAQVSHLYIRKKPANKQIVVPLYKIKKKTKLHRFIAIKCFIFHTLDSCSRPIHPGGVGFHHYSLIAVGSWCESCDTHPLHHKLTSFELILAAATTVLQYHICVSFLCRSLG